MNADLHRQGESTRGESTQEEILQAAYRLFLANGYHGTSMRQIAAEARVALGGIYNHFASKEALFASVLVAYHPYQYVLPALQAAPGKDLAEFVRDATERMAAGVGNDMGFMKLLFIELVEFDGQHVPQLFQQYYPQALGFTESYLAVQENLRPIPVPMMLRAFIGVLFAYGMTEMIVGTQMPAEMRTDAIDYLVDIFLHGVLQPEA